MRRYNVRVLLSSGTEHTLEDARHVPVIHDSGALLVERPNGSVVVFAPGVWWTLEVEEVEGS